MGAGGARMPGGIDSLIRVLLPNLPLQTIAHWLALLAGMVCVLLSIRLARRVRT